MSFGHVETISLVCPKDTWRNARSKGIHSVAQRNAIAEHAARSRTMLKRALSALVGIAIFLGLCFGGLLPFAIGATVIAALATQEWITAYQRAGNIEAKAGDRPRLPAWLNMINITAACAGACLPMVFILASLPLSFYGSILSGCRYSIKQATTLALNLQWQNCLSRLFVSLSLLVYRTIRSGKTLGKIKKRLRLCRLRVHRFTDEQFSVAAYSKRPKFHLSGG